MMADLMHEHMGHDGAERILALAPEVKQGAPVEPDHVRQFAGLPDRAAMGEAAPAKEAEEVEFGLGPHLVERLVVGEIDDLNHEPLAEATKSRRQPREGVVGERLDVGQGRRAEFREAARRLADHRAARGFAGASIDLARAASRPSTSRRVRAASAERTLSAAAGNSASTRRKVYQVAPLGGRS